MEVLTFAESQHNPQQKITSEISRAAIQ